LLSQPGNPTGVVYAEAELRALADVLERHAAAGHERPWIVSDECHRDWTFPGATFTSPVRVWDRVCVIYSFGKAHLLQGQRTGYLALSPRVAQRAEWSASFESITRLLGVCTPTALMQIAVRKLLALSPDVAPLVAQRDRLRDALAALGYEVTPSDGTFFLYARSPLADDFAFVEALAARGVLVLPSSIFHEPGHFRVSLTGTAEMLERALPAFRALAAGAA
jgi:aspartate aminotransferase